MISIILSNVKITEYSCAILNIQNGRMNEIRLGGTHYLNIKTNSVDIKQVSKQKLLEIYIDENLNIECRVLEGSNTIFL